MRSGTAATTMRHAGTAGGIAFVRRRVISQLSVCGSDGGAMMRQDTARGPCEGDRSREHLHCVILFYVLSRRGGVRRVLRLPLRWLLGSRSARRHGAEMRHWTKTVLITQD